MHASLALTSRSFTERTADRLEGAGILTRALFLIIAALTGAVLYLGLNWPGAQPPIVIRITPLPPIAAEPPPPQPAVLPVQASNPAGPMFAEAVRAVGAASKSVAAIEARSEPAATAASVAAPVRVAQTTAPVTTASTQPVTAATRPVASAAALDTTLPERPAARIPSGPNRISVPETPPAPESSASVPSAPPASPSGANRIVVPTVPPSP
jgi:hypothetical protein